MAEYANVIINISQEKLDRPFQYRVPEALKGRLYPGVQVLVPFGNGNRTIRGYVIELTDEAEIDRDRIKEIADVDTGGVPVEAQLISLAAWIRENYGGTMNQALKTVLPVHQKTRQKEKRTVALAVSRREAEEQLALFERKHNTARVRLLEALLAAAEASDEAPAGEERAAAGVSAEAPAGEEKAAAGIPYEAVTGKLHITPAVIRAMEELGLVAVSREQIWRNPISFVMAESGERGAGTTGERAAGTVGERAAGTAGEPDLKGRGRNREPDRASQKADFILNSEQQRIVDTITADFREGAYGTYLIHGVTGSGKTAVYIELIARAVAEGRQAIVLIPEIALTYQTVMRFYKRFGDRVSILHSKMSQGERYDQFLRAKNGELDVMIGPRSALFTPFSKLGYIIMDEEHEASYKSETVPRYHAREVAIERARRAGASVVLGSATPSLESYYRAKKGEYRLLELRTRIEEKPLPTCEIVDLREELRRGNRSILSGRLQELMEDRLKKGQQIMLFLNRRGISGFVSCRACGHVFRCPHCDVSLSQHNNGRLICHYCGYEEPVPGSCPKCGSEYVGGFKAGTQKIEQVVGKRFPKARLLRMDFDTTRSKEDYERILAAFANREADILIGTQMIVKGHDFPEVTLVGILAADLSLHISDYRGPERTFQLLTQAAGRAGRGQERGRVVIQTYSPDHYSIRLAARQDYEAFYGQEIAYRSLMRYPPVWHMMVMLAASGDKELAEGSARLLGQKLRQAQEKGKIQGLVMIGPADPPVAKVNDIYKKVIYFKHEDYAMLVRVKDVLEQFVEKHREFEGVTIQFDFDPMNGF